MQIASVNAGTEPSVSLELLVYIKFARFEPWLFCCLPKRERDMDKSRLNCQMC